MMLKTIQKWFQDHKTIMIPIAINLVIFIICFFFTGIYYDEIDDFHIQNILFGYSSGEFSSNSIHLNYFFSQLLGMLIQWVSSINWYAITLVVFQFFSFTLMGYYFMKMKGVKKGTLYYLFIGILFYSLTLSQIQYTCVAGICFASAFLGQYYMLTASLKRKEFAFHLVLTTLLIGMGICLRFDMLYFYIPFILAFLFIHAIKGPRTAKLRFFIVYLLLLGIVLLGIRIASNHAYQKADPTYCSYNDNRSLLVDFVHLDEEEDAAILNKVNWSPNDLLLFNNFICADETIYSEENLEVLLFSKFEEWKHGNLGITLNSVGLFFNKLFQLFKKYFFFFLIIIALWVITYCFQEKKKKNFHNIVFTTVFIGILLLLVIVDKCISRILFPVFIMYLMAYQLPIDFETVMKRIKISTYGILLTTMLILISIINSLFNIVNQVSPMKDLISYAQDHPQNAYVYCPYSLMLLYKQNDIFTLYPKGSFSNILPLGDWTYQDKRYYDFKERYQLENLIPNLLTKDNIYLMDAIKTEDNKMLPYLVTFLKEHYAQDVSVETVATFNDTYIIYQLRAISPSS